MLNKITIKQRIVFGLIFIPVVLSLHTQFLLEENKKRPKGQALIKGLSNPNVQKGAEFLRRSPWYRE